MIAKHRFGDLRVVLGADGQNDSPFFELLGVILQGEVRFAGRAPLPEDDAVEPVVADHAAPQGVVEIEDQTFLRQPALSGEDAGDEIAVKGRRLRSDFQLALKPAPDVEPGVNSVPRAGARHIEQQYAIPRSGLAQLIVEPRDDPRRAPRERCDHSRRTPARSRRGRFAE